MLPTTLPDFWYLCGNYRHNWLTIDSRPGGPETGGAMRRGGGAKRQGRLRQGAKKQGSPETGGQRQGAPETQGFRGRGVTQWPELRTSE